MNLPKISIIVPIYNSEKELSRCINSIQHQTYTNFELLLINDGSSDNSGIICDTHAQKDSRIRVYHKQNTGVSATRNVGIKNAKGEWICFIDSDDEITPNYLQLFIELLLKYDADCYVTGCKILSKGKCHAINLEEKDFGKKDIYKSIIYLREKCLLGVPWNKLFKASIIQKNNLYFDETISSYEDEIFVLQYLMFSKSVYTSPYNTYIYYSNNTDSLSKKYIEINTHFHIMEIIYELGIQFSKEQEYLRHVNDCYTQHLTESIYKLYAKNANFKRVQRVMIINLIKKKAKDKGLFYLLAKNLKRYHLYFFNNTFFLDINGQLLFIYHKLKK